MPKYLSLLTLGLDTVTQSSLPPLKNFIKHNILGTAYQATDILALAAEDKDQGRF